MINPKANNDSIIHQKLVVSFPAGSMISREISEGIHQHIGNTGIFQVNS